jgi:hypothetical protein
LAHTAPVVGSSFDTWAGQDAVTGEDLGTGGRILSGAGAILEVLPFFKGGGKLFGRLGNLPGRGKGAVRGAEEGGQALPKVIKEADEFGQTVDEAGRALDGAGLASDDVARYADDAAKATDEVGALANKTANNGNIANKGEDIITVYRVQPRTASQIVTGGAFRRARRAGTTILEAYEKRKDLLKELFHQNPNRRVRALENAQASGRKSPVISTTKNRILAEQELAVRRAAGGDYELLTIRGPKAGGIDFEEVVKELGGRKSPSRLKDAELEEFGILDLFIPANKPSKSGFRIVDRE